MVVGGGDEQRKNNIETQIHCVRTSMTGMVINVFFPDDVGGGWWLLVSLHPVRFVKTIDNTR